ncbi:MAG: hypothetical protein EF807_00495 [Candidatus Methanolliviera hydrocarbonicum]|uniref:acetate--CoA ligase (ADP-forming) n=1 Tax=Candidatus Methanolliviera hydrocarbonicum TaxID=2491085 RepID=A0A520KZ46_9EURY|nr:MAG: hypothetical protein EF807_00495 [Candidatus Methanolliviera hydrocarbonicum]
MEGIKDGRKFIDVAEKVTKRKPVIVFKAGKTRAGGRAARSHVGALAGSREIHNAAFKQAGIIQASTTSEILDLTAAFSNLPLPKGNRTVIITAGSTVDLRKKDRSFSCFYTSFPRIPDDQH